MLLTPFARAPPLIDRMSGRTQSASLIFWQIVTSPIVRTQFASAATAKGTARVACHDQPCAANPGGETSGAACTVCRSAAVSAPFATAAA
jgi:hypothetical protein